MKLHHFFCTEVIPDPNTSGLACLLNYCANISFTYAREYWGGRQVSYCQSTEPTCFQYNSLPKQEMATTLFKVIRFILFFLPGLLCRILSCYDSNMRQALSLPDEKRSEEKSVFTPAPQHKTQATLLSEASSSITPPTPTSSLNLKGKDYFSYLYVNQNLEDVKLLCEILQNKQELLSISKNPKDELHSSLKHHLTQWNQYLLGILQMPEEECPDTPFSAFIIKFMLAASKVSWKNQSFFESFYFCTRPNPKKMTDFLQKLLNSGTILPDSPEDQAFLQYTALFIEWLLVQEKNAGWNASTQITLPKELSEILPLYQQLQQKLQNNSSTQLLPCQDSISKRWRFISQFINSLMSSHQFICDRHFPINPDLTTRTMQLQGSHLSSSLTPQWRYQEQFIEDVVTFFSSRPKDKTHYLIFPSAGQLLIAHIIAALLIQEGFHDLYIVAVDPTYNHPKQQPLLKEFRTLLETIYKRHGKSLPDKNLKFCSRVTNAVTHITGIENKNINPTEGIFFIEPFEQAPENNYAQDFEAAIKAASTTISMNPQQDDPSQSSIKVTQSAKQALQPLDTLATKAGRDYFTHLFKHQADPAIQTFLHSFNQERLELISKSPESQEFHRINNYLAQWNTFLWETLQSPDPIPFEKGENFYRLIISPILALNQAEISIADKYHPFMFSSLMSSKILKSYLSLFQMIHKSDPLDKQAISNQLPLLKRVFIETSLLTPFQQLLREPLPGFNFAINTLNDLFLQAYPKPLQECKLLHAEVSKKLQEVKLLQLPQKAGWCVLRELFFLVRTITELPQLGFDINLIPKDEQNEAFGPILTQALLNSSPPPQPSDDSEQAFQNLRKTLSQEEATFLNAFMAAISNNQMASQLIARILQLPQSRAKEYVQGLMKLNKKTNFDQTEFDSELDLLTEKYLKTPST